MSPTRCLDRRAGVATLAMFTAAALLCVPATLRTQGVADGGRTSSPLATTTVDADSDVRPNDARDAELRGLAALVLEERERIAALRAEIERRNAALVEISARLDALTREPGLERAAPPAAAVQSTPPASPTSSSPDQPRFDFYGDALVRLATLHQSYEGCIGCPDRTVGRMRLRFGVQGQLAPGVRAVMGLAVGELNDPNTVYQTFGGNLGRKVASWDRGYISVRPPRASWMELSAGKFPYPWLRSSMTFDVDFYPEGASERFSFDLKRTGPLRSVSAQAVQIVVNELPNARDTLIIGGQAIAGFRLAPGVTSRVIVTEMDIRRPEHVLRSQLDGSNVGVRNTNAIVMDANGRAFYASAFRYANVIVENVAHTPWESMPLTFAVEYQRNLRAVSSRDTGTSLRFDAGRSARRGDWGFGWHVFRVEQDAIVSALGESDWRAPSNVLQHRFAATYMLDPHFQALFTWYRGRTLDRSLPGVVLVPNLPAGLREPWANRLYFDVLYRF